MEKAAVRRGRDEEEEEKDAPRRKLLSYSEENFAAANYGKLIRNSEKELK